MSSPSDAPFNVKMSGQGRRNDLPTDTAERLKLRQVPLDAGGYDPGGSYWGRGGGRYSGLEFGLWCAWDSEGRAAYVRAASRLLAQKYITTYAKNAKFYR